MIQQSHWVNRSATRSIKYLTRGVMGIVTMKVCDKSTSKSHKYIAMMTYLAYGAQVFGILRGGGLWAKVGVALGNALEMAAYVSIFCYYINMGYEGWIIPCSIAVVAASVWHLLLDNSAEDTCNMTQAEWLTHLGHQGLRTMTEAGGAVIAAAIAEVFNDYPGTINWLFAYSIVGYLAFMELELLAPGIFAQACLVIGYSVQLALTVTALMVFEWPDEKVTFLVLSASLVCGTLVPGMRRRYRAAK